MLLRQVLAVAAIAMSAGASAGAWTPWGPPGQPGEAVTIAAHPLRPGALQVAIEGDAYGGPGMISLASGDGGSTWPVRSTIAVAPSFIDTLRVAMGGDYRYALVNGRLLRSQDGGIAWTPLAMVANKPFAGLLGVDPESGKEVVVIGSPDIHHSVDAGESYADLPGLPFFAFSGAVDWADRRVYAIGWAVASKLLDAATPWTLGPEGIVQVAASAGKAIAVNPGAGLQHSPDGGGTWMPAFIDAPAFSIGAVAYSPTHPNVAFAVERFEGGTLPLSVLRSDDGGATWRPVGAVPGRAAVAGSTSHALVVEAGPPTALHLAMADGTWRSGDGGASWAPIPRVTGIASFATSGVIFDATDPLTRWVRVPTSLSKTANDGAAWSDIATFGSSRVDIVAASPSRSGLIYGVGRATPLDLALVRSSNGGASWTAVLPIAGTSRQVVGVLPGVDASDVFAFANSRGATGPTVAGVWRSVDEGLTWTAVGAPPAPALWLARAPGNPLVLYAVAGYTVQDVALYRSVDQASTWQRVPMDGVNGRVWSIVVAPSDRNRLYAGATVTPFEDAIFRSDDAGATWTRAWNAMPSTYLSSIAVDPSDSARVVVSARGSEYVEGNGVYFSGDAGTTWSALDDGLYDRAIWDVAFDPKHPDILYASTRTGAFRADVSTLPAGNRWAVEYYHARFDHYFVTADGDEIAALDAGAFEGWARTGQAFRVAHASSPDQVPTCRFFGAGFAPLSSHFYTPYPQECETVKQDPKWTYERIAFGLRLPEGNKGCAPGTLPLYRAWNRNRDGAPNHRYTTDSPTFEAMIDDGWRFEGVASTKVFACVPY